MNCPKCFGPLRPNQSFCPNCGTPVGAADFEVEKTVAADAAELDGFDSAQQPEPLQQPEPQQSPWQQPADPWNQPTQQPDMPQPDPWSQPTQQPDMPQPDPWAQPQQNNWQQPNAQQNNWQQPNVQQNNWQQPNSQQPNAWQQPAQPSNNYAQQYQQYQQSSNAGTRKGDGSLPPEKNNTPLIIIIIVLAVLLVGGGIVAAVLIVNNVKNSAPSGASSTVSTVSSQTSPQSSLIGFDSSASQQSAENSNPFGSSSPQSSLVFPSSRPEESSSASSSSPSLDRSHRVVNRNGLVLVEDEEIDVEDAEAQAVLERYLRENNVETSMSSGTLEGTLYPQGNALVYEYSYTAALTPEQEKTIQNTVQDMDSYTGSMVSDYQDETGVDDLVVVYAYISADGRLIAAAACHGE